MHILKIIIFIENDNDFIMSKLQNHIQTYQVTPQEYLINNKQISTLHVLVRIVKGLLDHSIILRSAKCTVTYPHILMTIDHFT